MSRAIAWILAVLALLISCELAYQETSLLASGPKVEEVEPVVQSVLLTEPGEEIEEPEENSAQLDKARRFFVEQLAKRLDIPMSSIAMGTAVDESSARVRIKCTTEQRAKIDHVLDDLQYPLTLLDIVSVTLTDMNGKPVAVNTVGSETLGYPLSRDLAVFEMLKNSYKPAADAVLQSGIAHNKKCMQSDPDDPVLVANQVLLNRVLSPQLKAAEQPECTLLKEIELRTLEREPDRANKASQLFDILGCTTGSDLIGGAPKLGPDDQAQFIRDNIHPDTIRSYLISDVYDRAKQPDKSKAALTELPDVRHQVDQSLLIDFVGFALTGIAFVAYLIFQKPKIFALPYSTEPIACPYPYGWIKPYLIIFIAVLFAVGGFFMEAAILGSHAEESTALLVSYFDPIKRAWLDNLDETMLLLPWILAATWLVNKGKFLDFVGLRFKPDQYSTKQLVKIGVECFILTWTPAMVATLLSYWFHFPWQKSSTVSTELLIGSGSWAAIAILFVGYAVLAPLLEEIVFRGLFHRAMRRHFAMWPSLIIGSAVFACVHFEFTPWWIIDKFIFAAVNVYAFEKTGSIVPGIISHLLTNAMVMLFMVSALN
ncbi:MAG: CPBP family glutamic-type intramembrane protease [Candidatus Melainabacteria bacterium]|nr:CPBP family glutamic-type intramembrane protease [Candidatus Melainabacteria bacterium]